MFLRVGRHYVNLDLVAQISEEGESLLVTIRGAETPHTISGDDALALMALVQRGCINPPLPPEAPPADATAEDASSAAPAADPAAAPAPDATTAAAPAAATKTAAKK